jgi:hypothetical protein
MMGEMVVLGLDMTGQPFVREYVGSTTATVVPWMIPDGAWHHWLVDPRDAGMQYIDGMSMSGMPLQPVPQGIEAGFIAHLGIFELPVDGMLAHRLYNNGTPTDLSAQPGLVAWWKLDDGISPQDLQMVEQSPVTPEPVVVVPRRRTRYDRILDGDLEDE